MYSHSELVKRFREGKTSGKSANMFIEGNTLYSYGHHFPLVWKQKEINGNDIYIKNGDKYSLATSRHQSIVQSYFFRYPTVNLSTIEQVIGNKLQYMVVSWANDYYKTIQFEEDDEIKNIEIPMGASFWVRQLNSDDEDTLKEIVIHRAGGVLLTNSDKTKYYICGMDEGSFFMSLLPRKAESVAEAYSILMPDEVKGKEFIRQGEWFFLEHNGNLPFKKKELVKSFPLPRTDLKGNRHVATRGIWWTDGEIYVTGVVRHKLPNSNFSTYQYSPLVLDSKYKQFFKAYKNTAIKSWGSLGGVG